MSEYVTMNFIIFFILLIFNYVYVANSDISDKRLCGDPTCSEPISVAVSLISFPSNEAKVLSFQKNVPLKIYSKSAGSRTDLWGAEYNGKRGYIPHKYVRETKVFKSVLNYLLPTEGHENEDQNNISTDQIKDEPSFDSFITSVPSVEVPVDAPSPTKVSEPYEVIDGTTILSNSNQEIVTEPTFKESDFQAEHKEKQNQNKYDLLKSNPVEDSQTSDEIVESNVTEIDSEAKENINNDGGPVNVAERNNLPGLFKESNISNESKEQLTEHDFISSSNESDSSVNDVIQDINEDDEGDDEDDYDDDDDDDAFVHSGEIEDNSSEIIDANINENINLETDNDNLNADQIIQSINEKNDDLSNIDIDFLIDNGSNPLENHEFTISSTETSSGSEQLEIISSNVETNYKNEHQSDMIKKVEVIKKNEEVDNNLQINQDDVQSVLNFKEKIENNLVNPIPDELKINENKLSLDNADVSIELPKTQSEIITESNFVENSIHVPLTFNNIEVSNIKADELSGVDFSQSLDTFHEMTTESIEAVNNFQENKLLSTNEESNIKYSQENFENKLEDNVALKDTMLNIVETTEHVTTSIIDFEHNLVNEKENFDNIEQIESVITNIDNVEQIESVSTNIDNVEQIESVSTNTDNVEHVPVMKKPVIEEILNIDKLELEDVTNTQGFFERFLNLFQSSVEDNTLDKQSVNDILDHSEKREFIDNIQESQKINILKDSDNCQICTTSSSQCPEYNDHLPIDPPSVMDFPAPSYDTFVYLTVTGITVLLFTLGYYYIEKMRQDGTLIGKINELEKALLISSKECIILKEDLQKTQEKLVHVTDTSFGSNETVQTLKMELEEASNVRSELEEKILNLEKELDVATEAGLELNIMLSDLLTSQNGSDNLVQSVEKLQTQLNDQQNVITDMNSTLGSKNNENELLQSEISIANEKIVSLQLEVDKLVENLVSLQKEKVSNEQDFEKRLKDIQLQLDTVNQMKLKEVAELTDELKKVQTNLKNTERHLEVKEKELNILHESVKSIQEGNNDVQNLFEVSQLKAEFDQCMKDRDTLFEKLQNLETAYKLQEGNSKETVNLMEKLKSSLDDAEKEKIEAQMRLEVLSSYFKEREVQLQKDLARHEELWLHNQGETNSTVERMKVLQQELQNYKSQNEMLKKEIVDQEVSLKSQISVLEKKVHENWLVARQAERRLEESKQECAQLRNRLTIVEKNLTNSTQLTDETKSQYRVLSPLNTNGNLHGSPLHIPGVESSASPPLLFPPREHMTTSPPLPFMGLPPPPPPGVPFMPPPPGVPFMPPPPSLYPGDRRPPPLGRMSSPPPSTFSPNRTFSPYDRDNSPSRFPSNRPYGSLDQQFRDMDNYRHMSPPPVNQYEIHPDTNNEWDEPHRTTGQRSRSSRQKKGAMKNDI